MNIYFVCCNVPIEKEALKKVKPERLLLSYFYFKNKDLNVLFEEIGYKPKVLLDSGAYSAFTKGKTISIIEYMNFLTENKDHINKYITLDVIGDPDISFKYYEIMKMKGFNPIPVYHYGDSEHYLEQYIARGNDYIALGNTVPIKDKNKVATWVNELTEKYPNVKFHLLGSSSKKVTQGTTLYSVDSSTWVMMAVNGKPKEIPGMSREAKVGRAVYHLNKITEECQ